MIVVTTETVPGKNFTVISFVEGSKSEYVFSMSINAKKNMENITQIVENTRNLALQRMIVNAQAMGADAVVAVRYAVNVLSGLCSIVAYGTAVKFV
ncbi:MAG: heavy metal-binding domain-containing protein [Oscillospiraceae bacterium]|nr:heavy metal-binding domain-containing protein [Oscillospiraceae bacterium]